LLICSIWN